MVQVLQLRKQFGFLERCDGGIRFLCMHDRSPFLEVAIAAFSPV
jgi:hypothetical protein